KKKTGILSHYAYVKKSNYLLPDMILPLIRDAIEGRSFIDPDIEQRVQEVRLNDRQRAADTAPLDLLEANERRVAVMLARGLSNQQIAERLGFRDKRSVARINGQIYATWGLNDNAEDEKVARTRAAMIVREGRLIAWDDDGSASVRTADGDWIEWK
ncbi:MAG: response regulator transcription factor, partial [Leptospiraceae bacterium]|nr:response regulator transcription factor [Leptospiraceae bacterium]